MEPNIRVKICGITDEENLDAAIEAGADLIGLVFYPPSPRAITPLDASEILQFLDEEGPRRVGLFVDADDTLLNQVLSHVRLDFLQFHGSESPERIEQVRLEYGLPIIKSIPLAVASDLAAIPPYQDVADWLLFDARAPAEATRPGGNAASFDWTLLQGFSCPIPWMLAGGLTAENVAEAIQKTGARMVDVSSGVEKAPGVKDIEKMKTFIAAARGVKGP